MPERLRGLLTQPLAWIGLAGVGALAFLALSPAPEPPKPQPTPLSTTARMDLEMDVMRQWAVKSKGDFDKVPAEVQGYMNQISRGHGREWLRLEAKRLLGRKVTPATSTKP